MSKFIMNATGKKFHFLVEKTNTGFSVFSEDYPIYSTGKNMTELQSNIVEATNLFLEDQGLYIKPHNITLEIDLKQFFTYYRVINAKFLAHRIGMNETLLSQYVKGNKKPSKKQIERILTGIQQIGKELSEIKLIQ